MNIFYVYLPNGEILEIEAEEYAVEGDQVYFMRNEKPLNMYLNKTGVCIISEDTSLESPKEEVEDEVDLFKSVE